MALTKTGRTGLVIVPAFNEEASIGATLEELVCFWPPEDIIVINDGSKDQTSAVVASHGVKQLVHPTNMGYGTSLHTGVRYAERAGYQYVVTLDADGQHDPSFLVPMVECLHNDDADVVVGSRFKSTCGYQIPLGRRVGMWIFRQVTRAFLGGEITDTSSGYKAIHRRVFHEMGSSHLLDYHAELLIFLKLRGYRVAEIGVNMRPRYASKSFHSLSSFAIYPAKTLLGILVGTAAAIESRFLSAYRGR
jgi:glycosyltransferase involved in cell wall biosynthesis